MKNTPERKIGLGSRKTGERQIASPPETQIPIKQVHLVSAPSHFSYTPLGGGREIGRSSYVNTFGKLPVMIDCGMKPLGSDIRLSPENIKKALPKLFRYQGRIIRNFVITHGHYDHCGALICGLKELFGPNWLNEDFRIYMTYPTKVFTRLHLLDMAKTMKNWEWQKTRWLFTERDVERLMEKKVVIVIADGKNPVCLDRNEGLYMLPVGAGHMYGAMSVWFLHNNELYFHSGDISWDHQHFTQGAKRSIPPLLKQFPVRFANFEGTYANHDHHDDEENIVDASISVLERGGKALIPTLAINHAQEIWMEFCANNDRIPMNRVFVDGSARRYFDVFAELVPEARILRFAQKVPDGWEGARWHKAFEREKIARSEDPAIIIASGAMLQERSSAYYWADLLISNKKNAIFFTSFLDKCSVGHDLVESVNDVEKALAVFGGKGVGGAEIKKFNLSAHTDRRGTRSFMEILKPRVVAYHHAEMNEMKPIMNEMPNLVYPKLGKEVIL